MIRIKTRCLRAAGLLCLLLPAAAFLLTWVRPVIAVPSVLMLAAAFYLFTRRDAKSPMADAFGESGELCISWLSLLAVIACAVLWTFLSGMGGMFYQNEDHYGRNAIFHDMLENPWPVYFEGTDFALTYYIAYWILPALFAKGAAVILGEGVLWSVGNAALFAQTVVFLMVIFLLFLSLVRAKRLPAVLTALLVFVMFSGMDGLPAALKNDWNNQIEWWAETYQFSCNTTCLFWVYNQALPAWIATLLLLSRPMDFGWYALLGLAAFPFSPMPFVGLFFLMGCMFAGQLAKGLSRDSFADHAKALFLSCLTSENLLACAALLPSFGLYFMSNQASSEGGFTMQLFFYAWGPAKALARLMLFWLIEFGALALVVVPRYKKHPLLVIACVSLLLAPMFRLGFKADFSMRASIPGLTVLCVYAAHMLLDCFARRALKTEAVLLAVLLALGAITPMLEFERGAYKVMMAGTNFMYSDPFKTVLHEDADTFNFICNDVNNSTFYRHFARKGPADR